MTIVPNDQRAEQALIGSVLIDPSSFSAISDSVKHEDFYSQQYQGIWSAFERLEAKGEPIDQVTVYSEAKDVEGIGVAMNEAMAETPMAGNPEAYAKIVNDMAV